MMPNQQQQKRGSTGSVLRMIRMLDMCATTLQDGEAALLLGMAAKSLAQLQSHSIRVTAEAVKWQGKYEQMEQLYDELEEKNVDLDEENELLLFKCQLLEANERALNDDMPEKMDYVSDKKEQFKCALLPDQALLKAAPSHETTTTMTNSCSFSFSDDVYGHSDLFEHSLNTELEEFQELGFKGSSSIIARASLGENEKKICERAFSPCCEVIVSDTPSPMSPLQDKTPKPSKDTASTANMNPLQLFQRMFITQTDVPMPALTTSDSLTSLSSDYSVSTESLSSRTFSMTPTKKSVKNSPQPNAEWAIIESNSA